jgi:glucosamine--fructose-6-phosphate aminotransferase (isomerizing)
MRQFLRDADAGEHPIDEIAQRFYQEPFFLFLGRHIGLPIALLSEGTPVVTVATNLHVDDKIVSNIQECRSREAHVIAIATDGNEDIQHHANDVIYVPKSPAFLQAVLATLPLQLLAYRIARLRGADVDQPRNLAKTVTVE